MNFLLAVDPLEDVYAQPIFHVGSIPITNQMLMALLAALLMLFIFPRLFRKPQSDAPTGARNLFESILEFLRVEVFRPALKEHTDRFVPYLWTLFFFILFCNLLGCIPLAPLIEAITVGHVKYMGGAATGTVSTTGALAAFAFVMIHVSGISQVARSLMNGSYGHHEPHDEHTSDGSHNREAAHDLEHMRGEGLGADVPSDFRAVGNPVPHYNDDRPRHLRGTGERQHEIHTAAGMNPVKAWLLSIPLYLWNFAPHPFKPQKGQSGIMWLADIPMFIFLLFLELLGALVKPFALCMRLYGNMVAGHVLLAVLISLIVVGSVSVQLAIGAAVAPLDIGIQILEIFVAFLQAYIFVFLTTLFIASAVAPEH